MTFTFRADTKDEEAAWKRMFQECIWYAPNPMHSDQVRRSAFEDTYMALERERGWGSWYFYASGSESDMLALYIFKRISYEVLNDVFQKLPAPGMLRDKAISTIESSLGKMIGPAVAAAWTGACLAIDKIEKPIEDKIRQAVTPLFEAIKQIKERVQGKFEEKVTPVISKLSEPLTTKLFPKLFKPLQDAFKKLISEFVEHKDSPRGTYHLYWEIRDKLDDFDDLLSVAREILDVEELGEFTTKVNDTCTQLLEKAHYTYKVHKDNKMEKAFETTCDELLHDAIMDMNGLAKWLLDALVLKPFNEAFGAALAELCGPLEELIPEPVKEFLSPSDTLKEMANAAVSSALKAILDSGGNQSGPLMHKFVEKGVADIKIIAGPVAAPASPAASEEKKPAEEKKPD